MITLYIYKYKITLIYKSLSLLIIPDTLLASDIHQINYPSNALNLAQVEDLSFKKLDKNLQQFRPKPVTELLRQIREMQNSSPSGQLEKFIIQKSQTYTKIESDDLTSGEKQFSIFPYCDAMALLSNTFIIIEAIKRKAIFVMQSNLKMDLNAIQ